MRHERRIDERFRAALLAPAEPENPFERALWQFRYNGVAADAIIRVVDMYEDTFERELLQAWIIAGADDQMINARMGASLDMLPAYRHLCCNTSVFRDRFELLRWVRSYQGTDAGKILLEKAVHFDGIEGIAHLCGLPTHLDPAYVNEQVMRETYFRGSTTLRSSDISSKEANDAHAMLRSAMSAAQAAGKRSAPNMAETLLKLKHREMTFKADEVVPREEIMN